MSILGINNALAGVYQCAAFKNVISKDVDKTKGIDTTESNFTDRLKETEERAGTSKVDAYMGYLKSKYGNVSIQSVGKDQKSLDRIGKSMSGSDVVIAPNILEQMANDTKKAAYYEGKIDYYFNTVVPRENALCAALGLVYEPGGVVIHEDGTVTYIGGCSDSPERVAEVNAINKAKREKEAAQRKASMERSKEAAQERKRQMDIAYQQKIMAEFFGWELASDFLTIPNHAVDAESAYTPPPEIMGNVAADYSFSK